MKQEAMPSPEEMANFNKSRIKSDVELVDGGAEVTPDGKIIPTEEQIKDAKIEMGQNFKEELEKMKASYEEHIRNLEEMFKEEEETTKKLHVMTEVNGKFFELVWVHKNIGYELVFGMEADGSDYDGPKEDAIREPYIRVGKDDKEALSLFNRAVELANGKDDLRTIYKKVEKGE